MSNILVNQLTGNTTDTTIEVFAGHAADSTTRTNLEQGLVKAYMDLKGTGTISVRGSLNTSTATDNGAGDFTQNFTNSFANNDHSSWMNCANEISSAHNVSIGHYEISGGGLVTGSLRGFIQRSSGVDVDNPDVNYGTVGDLA